MDIRDKIRTIKRSRLTPNEKHLYELIGGLTEYRPKMYSDYISYINSDGNVYIEIDISTGLCNINSDSLVPGLDDRKIQLKMLKKILIDISGVKIIRFHTLGEHILNARYNMTKD